MSTTPRRHSRWLALALATAMAATMAAVPSLADSHIQGDDRIAADAALAERIDAVARAALSETALAGMSIAVGRSGDIVFADGYGSADLRTELPASAETVYQIGSVSKQFTAAAIVLLADRGLVSLDDPASDYVQLPPADPAPTLAQLLSHTSGVVDTALGPALERSRDGVGMSMEEALDLARAPGYAWLPGAFYQYGNGNYLLSYQVIEAATGRGYGGYVADEVLPRAGLSTTTMCPATPPAGWATSYQQPEGNWERALRLGRPLPLIEVGQVNMDIVNSVCSTAPDLVRWAHALRTGRVVSTDGYNRMASPTALTDGTVVPYGLGLQLRRFGDHQAVAHGGIIGGFLTMLADFPEDDVTVSLLLNTRLSEGDVTMLYERLLSAVFDVPAGQHWTAELGSATFEGIDQ